MSPNEQPVFTEAEIEKMRRVVFDHDKKTGVHEFDLNNPPRKPYRHQELPRLMYALDADDKPIHKTAHTEKQVEDMLATGWSITPVAPIEAEEIELDAATQAEVAEVEAKIAAAKAEAKKKAKRATR